MFTGKAGSLPELELFGGLTLYWGIIRLALKNLSSNKCNKTFTAVIYEFCNNVEKSVSRGVYFISDISLVSYNIWLTKSVSRQNLL